MALSKAERRFVGVLSLAQLCTWGGVFYAFALLMAPVEQALGLTRAQSSLGFSLALLAEGLLAYPVGRWIDQGHERWVMAGGSLLAGICLLLHSAVHGPVGFYLVWLGLGAAMAATLYTSAFAMVTRRFPQDFRQAVITLTFLGGLASTVFLPLIAWLVQTFGWRQALWALAAVQLLVCLPLHLHLLKPGAKVAVPDRAPDAPAVPAADATSTSTSAATAAAAAANRSAPDLGAATHLRSLRFWLVASFAVLIMTVGAAVPPHLVNLLREAGLSEHWAIALPASIGVMQVAGRLLLYVFESRLDVDRTNRWLPCLIPAALVVLLAGAGQVGAVVAFVLLYGVGNGLLTIVRGTAVAQYVSRTHAATLNGAIGLPGAIARAIAPWMLGVLWSPALGYRPGIAILLGLSTAAVLALWAAQRLARASS